MPVRKRKTALCDEFEMSRNVVLLSVTMQTRHDVADRPYTQSYFWLQYSLFGLGLSICRHGEALPRCKALQGGTRRHLKLTLRALNTQNINVAFGKNTEDLNAREASSGPKTTKALQHWTTVFCCSAADIIRWHLSRGAVRAFFSNHLYLLSSGGSGAGATVFDEQAAGFRADCIRQTTNSGT